MLLIDADHELGIEDDDVGVDDDVPLGIDAAPAQDEKADVAFAQQILSGMVTVKQTGLGRPASAAALHTDKSGISQKNAAAARTTTTSAST